MRDSALAKSGAMVLDLYTPRLGAGLDGIGIFRWIGEGRTIEYLWKRGGRKKRGREREIDGETDRKNSSDICLCD